MIKEYELCYDYFKTMINYGLKFFGIFLTFNAALAGFWLNNSLKIEPIPIFLVGLLINISLTLLRLTIVSNVDFALKRMAEIEQNIMFCFGRELAQKGSRLRYKNWFSITYMLVTAFWLVLIVAEMKMASL